MDKKTFARDLKHGEHYAVEMYDLMEHVGIDRIVEKEERYNQVVRTAWVVIIALAVFAFLFVVWAFDSGFILHLQELK